MFLFYDTWKLPFEYSLIVILDATKRGNLVQQCVIQLHSVGVTVVPLTFDGSATNLSMLGVLGCNNIKSSLLHPVTQQQNFSNPDPCLMLKLLRNTFAEKNLLVSGQGTIIK